MGVSSKTSLIQNIISYHLKSMRKTTENVFDYITNVEYCSFST